MKALGHDAGTDLVSLVGKPLAEGVDRGNSQTERGDRHESEGKIDMITFSVAVRRRLRRPRWCQGYLSGCCKRNPCSLPHHSETAVAEIREKKAVYKAFAASHAGPRVKKGAAAASPTAAAAASSAEATLPLDEEAGNEWFRGRARNCVNRNVGVKISGPHYFISDLCMPDGDGECDVVSTTCPVAVEVVPSMCAVTTDDGNDSWATTTLRFDLPDGYEEKPTWRRCRSSALRVVPGLA